MAAETATEYQTLNLGDARAPDFHTLDKALKDGWELLAMVPLEAWAGTGICRLFAYLRRASVLDLAQRIRVN